MYLSPQTSSHAGCVPDITRLDDACLVVCCYEHEIKGPMFRFSSSLGDLWDIDIENNKIPLMDLNRQMK